ncbi:hypothetical protein ABTZ03_03270 [Kitasatospora sp. NPDC096077]|uniref:hypothetical protein n=1 Tax=Kitasatospora sp. NPDC096077 TaxID=3155544 RepID=UPI00331CC78C
MEDGSWLAKFKALPPNATLEQQVALVLDGCPEVPDAVRQSIAEGLASPVAADAIWRFERLNPNLAAAHRAYYSTQDAVRDAAEELRQADTSDARRVAVEGFLLAMSELILYLVGFLALVLMALLSRLLGRAGADHVPTWRPEPIEESPQITPRGPNSAFPVCTYRGGLRGSALGSVVVAA